MNSRMDTRPTTCGYDGSQMDTRLPTAGMTSGASLPFSPASVISAEAEIQVHVFYSDGYPPTTAGMTEEGAGMTGRGWMLAKTCLGDGCGRYEISYLGDADGISFADLLLHDHPR